MEREARLGRTKNETENVREQRTSGDGNVLSDGPVTANERNESEMRVR